MESVKPKTKVQKKRIAPQKAADFPVVASVSEDIILESFQEDPRSGFSSTAGIGKKGIKIDIRATPMVQIQQVNPRSVSTIETSEFSGNQGKRIRLARASYETNQGKMLIDS